MSALDYYRWALSHSPLAAAALLSGRPVTIACPTESEARALFDAAARALTSERPSELAGPASLQADL